MREVTTTRRAANGYTLVEMVTALAIVGILMLGVASAMLVASRAIDPDTRPRTTHAAAEAAARVVRELEFATAFAERSAAAVTFTVADRTGDGSDETIRYAWSGTAGDPLTRQYNGGTSVAVVEDVRECAFTCDLETLTEEPDPTRSESAEMALAVHTVPSDAKDFAVQNSVWIGQYFKPSLPGSAVSWSVTRALVKCRLHGAAKGKASVQLRLPTAGNLPSREVLEGIHVHENRLTDGYLWQEFTFSNAAGLSPSRGLCLTVVRFIDDADICDVQYDGDGPGGMCQTNSGEGAWSTVLGKSMVFAVYGTVTTSDDPDPVTRTWVRGVHLRLRAGPDPSTAVETGVRVLNAPEVTN
jgi:prepilin-type N-terminal cleavage/methylation domain-containing protein